MAAAAARARVVGVEEEVINQQRASRRQMHKICEQKRRDGLKTALETLKMTIPGCSVLSDQSQQNILLKGKVLHYGGILFNIPITLSTLCVRMIRIQPMRLVIVAEIVLKIQINFLMVALSHFLVHGTEPPG